jgi:tetratricopeptide (TPR) repeat protein
MPLLGRRGPSTTFMQMLRDLLEQGRNEAKTNPNNAKVTLRKIHRLISDADQSEKMAIEENKEEVIKILLEAGELLFELSDKDKSIDYFEKVKELDPKNVKAWYEIGRILISQNLQIPYAIVNLKKAIELDPTNYKAMELLGDLFRIRHEDSEAIKWYREAMKYSENKIELLDKILAVNPNDMDALNEKLNFYISKGMKEEAAMIYLQLALSKNSLDLVDEGLKLLPNNPQLLKAKARMLLSMGKKSEAQQFIEKVEKLAPDDPELIILKSQMEEKEEVAEDLFGELTFGEEEPDENTLMIALYDPPTLRKHLKNFGSNESFREKLDRLLSSIGRSMDLLPAVEEILKAGVDLKTIEDVFPEKDGIRAFVSGDKDSAEKFFNNIVQKDQKNPVAWYYKARIANEKGNKFAAKNFLSMAIRLGYPKELVDPSLLELVS